MIKDRNIDPNAQINPAKIMGGLGFGAGFLSGAPRPGSDLAGKVYYVHPDYGSDSNDGLSPENPYKTILQARTVSAARINWSASPWSNCDSIVLFPGIYDETNLTAGLYGVDIIGLGLGFDLNGEHGVVIKPSANRVWDAASWINGSISNVGFLSVSGSVPCVQVDTVNRFLIQDCVFQGVPGASATTTIGFEVVVDMTGSRFMRNIVNQCLTGISLGVTAPKQITGDLFEDFIITSAETAGVQLDSDCTASNTIFRRFVIGPTPTLGIDDNASDAAYRAMWIDGHIYASNCDPATASGGKYSHVYLNGVLMTTS